MRGLRSTLLLAVILAGLGAYAYFVVSKQEDTGAPKQDKVFAGIEADKIDQLTIKSESGDVTTIKKDAAGWQFVTPAGAKASDGEVLAVTSALQNVDIARIVEENAADLKPYGLDPARIDVEFKSADGKTAGHLLIGQKSTAGGNLYAKRADQPRVFLIPGFNESSFNKAAFDLRDKALMTFDRGAVDGIDVVTGGKSFHLAKAGDDWKLTTPVATRADVSAVDGLISRIEMAQMKSVAANSAAEAELKTYGLDKPEAVVTLNMGSARASVAVGGKTGEDVYVRDTSKPAVATIEGTFGDDLKKGFEDYRRKEVFDFKAFNATHVEFSRGGKTVTFDRVKAADGKGADTWKRVSPTAADADKEKIETLLTGLADIRGQSFKDTRTNTGLDAPVLTVVAKFDEGKNEERVTFGKVGTDVYAGTVDPGAAKIEASRLDEALKLLDELSK